MASYLIDSLADIGMGGLLDPWENPYQYLNVSNGANKGHARKDHNLVPINSERVKSEKGSERVKSVH